MTLRTPRPRGFTLIELLMVVGIATVLGSTFFSVMYMQNSSYVARLDEVDAHQDARAALNIIRRYVRQARFGIDPNSIGEIPVGLCYNTTAPTTTQTACNNVAADGGADRLRVLFMVGDTEFVQNANNNSDGPCGSGVADTTRIFVGPNPVTPFASAALGMISGTCGTNSLPASTLIYIGADSGAAGLCNHRYGYTVQNGTTGLCGGTGTGYYAFPFNFGRAVAADFYILQGGNTTTPPQLMLRSDPRAPIATSGALGYQPQIVAYDIEDMQIRYGIDTTAVTDRAVDVWCDDPRTASAGGTGCTLTDSNGVLLSQQAIYNRIMALQVSLRVRTDMKRQNVSPNPLNPNLLVANPVVNVNDGFQRWQYTTTVMLRNNPI